MVATDGNRAGMLDYAIGINNKISGATADIDDERAEVFLFGGQQGKRGSEAVENDVFDFQLQDFDETDEILQTVRHAVDDVNIHFQPRTEHAYGIGHAVLAVYKEMLANGVDDAVLGGQ